METWLMFSLKSIIAGYALYLIYYLAMRKDTWHLAARIYLCLAMAVSLLIPLIPLPQGEDYIAAAVDFGFSMDELVVFPVDGVIATNFDFISILYFAVCGLFLLRFIYRAGVIASIARKGTRVKLKGYSIVYTDGDLPSFTFLNMIFINREKYSVKDLEIIVAHEKVHALKLHSFDILLVELLQAFFWFNPVLFLFRSALASVHEYQADRAILDSGVGLSEYGMLIMKESLNTQSVAFSINFNSSIIRRRISMMKQIDSSKVNLYKPLLGLVVVLALVFAFNLPDSNGKPPKKSDSNQEFVKLDKAPECDVSELSKNIVYPEIARKNGISCVILVKAFVSETGTVTKTETLLKEKGRTSKISKGSVYEEFAKAAVEAVSKTKFIPGQKDNVNVEAWVTIPINFKLTEK